MPKSLVLVRIAEEAVSWPQGPASSSAFPDSGVCVQSPVVPETSTGPRDNNGTRTFLQHQPTNPTVDSPPGPRSTHLTDVTDSPFPTHLIPLPPSNHPITTAAVVGLPVPQPGALQAAEGPVAGRAAAGGAAPRGRPRVAGRGLHSSTFRLN